jgi:hypothetical protein
VPPSESQSLSSSSPPVRRPAPWLRRLGLAGFLFFLVKGLLWLAVPIAVAVWRAMAS